MRAAAWLGCGLVAACGRIDFDPVIPSGSTCVPSSATQTTALAPGGRYPSLAIMPDRVAVAYWLPSGPELGIRLTDHAGMPVAQATLLPGTSAAANVGAPAIGWTGTELGVLRSLAQMGTPNHDVRFTRLDGSGAVIGPDTTVTSSAFGAGPARLAWNGGRFGASWPASVVPETGAWFAPIGADGTRLAAGVQLNALGSDCTCRPELAWNGAEWAVVFIDDSLTGSPSDVWLTRVDQDGNVVASEVSVSEPGALTLPAIAWNGARYAVVWSQLNPVEMVVQDVESDGTRGITTRRPVDAGVTFVRVVASGDAFFVAWSDSQGIELWSFDSTLAPTAAPMLIVGAPGVAAFDLAVADGAVFVAWNDASTVALTRVACE